MNLRCFSFLMVAFGLCLPVSLYASNLDLTEARILDTSTGDGVEVSGYARWMGQGIPGGAFFYVDEIDGVIQSINNLNESRTASWGLGRGMRFITVDRPVPPGKHRIKISGKYMFAAPIESLFRSAASYSVEGEIEVELRPNTKYRVSGVLEPLRQEVWLEEIEGGNLVGQKLVNVAVEQERIKAMEGASYTCCNLHYQDEWISDTNASTLPYVPAGARIVIKDYGRHRIHVLIDGRPMTIGHDYGRKQETKEQYVAKLLVAEDPKARIDTFEAAIQKAIRTGKVCRQMTKEQVIISLGYPRTDTTTSLDASAWKYRTADEDEYEVVWGEDGRLREVRAEEPQVLSAILMEGG